MPSTNAALPMFVRATWNDHVKARQAITKEIEDKQWQLGAIAASVSAFIQKATTAHVLPFDGCLVTDEMRVELLALSQNLFTARIADNLAFAEETLVTPLLLNQQSHLVLDC